MDNTKRTIEVRGQRDVVNKGLQRVRMLAAREPSLDPTRAKELQAVARRPVWCADGAVLFVEHEQARELSADFVRLAERVGLSCRYHGRNGPTDNNVHFVIAGNWRDVHMSLSAHASAEEAYVHRGRAWHERGKRTSPVVEVPADLAHTDGFAEVARQILDAAKEVAVPRTTVVMYPWLDGAVDASAGGVAFFVVQEGGSSDERYLTGYDSLADAHRKRENAWREGSYRTSPVVQVPLRLADHPAFTVVVQELLFAEARLSAGPESIERQVKAIQSKDAVEPTHLPAPHP